MLYPEEREHLHEVHSMGDGSRVFLTITDIRLLFHEAAPEFRLSAAGVKAQGEVRGIILQCTWAQIFQYVAISSAKSLTWLWMLQLWVFATDDLYMKKDKHF